MKKIKFLGFTLLRALHYGGSLNGMIMYGLYLGMFQHFQWDVENRCIKKWNGGEEWFSIHGEMLNEIKQLTR